jgi:hypothetical protein
MKGEDIMDQYIVDQEELEAWKNKVLIIGAVIGALVGAGAAYIYTQKAEDYRHKPDFSTGDGVRLSLLLLGLVRQISDLGERK